MSLLTFDQLSAFLLKTSSDFYKNILVSPLILNGSVYCRCQTAVVLWTSPAAGGDVDEVFQIYCLCLCVWKNHKEAHITASNVRRKSMVNCNCFWRADLPTRAGKLKIIHIKAWQTMGVEVHYKHPAIPTPNIWTQGRCLPARKKEVLSLLKKCWLSVFS